MVLFIQKIIAGRDLGLLVLVAAFEQGNYLVRREVFVGLALGAILGAIGFLRISIWGAFLDAYPGIFWPLLGLTVAFALVGVVLWGSLVGSLLPLVLQKLGFDPAVSSAPFVATLVDVTGLIIYFSIALVLL